MTEKVTHLNSHKDRISPNIFLWIGFLVSVMFYLADALVDAYIFHAVDLRETLLRPSAHELWMRLAIAAFCMLLAVFACRQLKREQLYAQRALLAESFLNSVVDNIPDMIFIKDAQDLRFVRVNAAAERLLGFSSSEMLGQNDYDLFPGSQADFFTGKDREVLQTGNVVSIPEEEIETRHLGTRMLRTKKVPIRDAAGQPAYLLGIAEDITESWMTRQKLQKTEVRFQTLFNFAAEFIFVIDAERTILLTNRYAVENSGYSESEIIGSNIRNFFTEDSRNICDSNFPILRETGTNRVEIEFVCRDGRVLQTECSATAVPDESGNFTSFLIIQRDVTERKQAAVALENSERRFRAIFNSTYQLIGLLDENGTVLEVNQTALDLAGLDAAEVIGKPLWEIAWGGLSQQALERVRTAVRDAARGTPVRYEEEVVVGAGDRRILDFTLKPVTDENGKTVLIIPEGRDITDSRLAEEEAHRNLQEAAHVMRLGTMGEMASTIAHELNQPLTALVSYCGTAKSMAGVLPPQSDKLIKILDHATEQAHRASDIIRHFREFVCKGKQHRQHINLDSLVEDAIRLLRGELRNTGITVELHLDSGNCRIHVDKIQIEQVIINLLRNSMDAIRHSGRSAGRIDLYTRSLPSGTVELTVIDNGPGVAPEQLGHLFEPFNSNKATGMGMGLSISRSIVEAHGGRIWNNRYQQGGAQFVLTLPECEADDGEKSAHLSG